MTLASSHNGGTGTKLVLVLQTTRNRVKIHEPTVFQTLTSRQCSRVIPERNETVTIMTAQLSAWKPVWDCAAGKECWVEHHGHVEKERREPVFKEAEAAGVC